MNLFEIDYELMKCFDEETGEIFDSEMFDSLAMARDTKIENIGCWIKNLKAEAEALKAEEESFKKRRQSAENKAKSLSNYLSAYLNGQKFKTPKLAISWRKSTTVECGDWQIIPEDYLKFKEPEPNKTAIKEALKNGTEVPGCYLLEKQNMSIK